MSTHTQELDLQRDALESAGCAQIFEDVASGVRTDREGLEQALSALGEGDVLVVWRLDRLGRSLPHLVEAVNRINEQGAHLRCLDGLSVDTSTASGALMFHIFAALAQFEREITRERVLAGLQAARERGVRLGPTPKLSGAQLDEIITRVEAGEWSQAHAARMFGVHPSTITRGIRRRKRQLAERELAKEEKEK